VSEFSLGVNGVVFDLPVCALTLINLGSNWIPADNFLTTLKADRYRAWLTLLRDGNQNMVRLWGGGMLIPSGKIQQIR